MDYEPFAGIIQRALQARGTAEGDLAHDSRHLAPRYVVRMCEALAQAAAEHSGRDVRLDDIIRLERTCTGADYHHKLAMRCAQLASCASPAVHNAGVENSASRGQTPRD